MDQELRIHKQPCGQNLCGRPRTQLSIRRDRRPGNEFTPGNANEVYGHLSPYVLRNELTSSSAAEYGAFLNCCSDCGFPDCWGVIPYPLITQDCVIWQRFAHTHKTYNYDLEFCFEKKAYEAQLVFLKKCGHNSEHFN